MKSKEERKWKRKRKGKMMTIKEMMIKWRGKKKSMTRQNGKKKRHEQGHEEQDDEEVEDDKEAENIH